jgi:hypothetical protein
VDLAKRSQVERARSSKLHVDRGVHHSPLRQNLAPAPRREQRREVGRTHRAVAVDVLGASGCIQRPPRS